jgi:uncharacterized protein (DUF1330 family)
MPALWVTLYKKISDPSKLSAYAALAVPAITAGGGQFIARGVAAHAYEGGILERTVIISFPSVKAANDTYNSLSYKEALAALGDGAERDLRIVETVA